MLAPRAVHRDNVADGAANARRQWLVSVQDQAMRFSMHLYRHRLRLRDERAKWIESDAFSGFDQPKSA